MRTIHVQLTLHAAVRYRSRAGANSPALKVDRVLPNAGLLAGRELRIKGGRFRLKPGNLPGTFTAATFVADASVASGNPMARTERVRIVWGAVTPP